MLEGWYCRSMANQEAKSERVERDPQESDDEHNRNNSAAPTSSSAAVDYRERYKNLKRKLKFLIYENEYFQDLLSTNQRRLLKVSRDRAFLLDRLLLYEKPAKDSSDSDATDSSDDVDPCATATSSTGPSLAEGRTTGGSQQLALNMPKEGIRRRKLEGKGGTATIPGVTGGATRGRKRKIQTPAGGGHPIPAKKQPVTARISPSPQQRQLQQPTIKDMPLSTAEITRQLQERRPTPIEFMSPECTSATVPATMLSDESPSKCYPNESLQQLMEDDSHVAAEECVPMEYANTD